MSLLERIKGNKIILGASLLIVFLFFCAICMIAYALTPISTSQLAAPIPTNTPEPTDIPLPTSTPPPSPQHLTPTLTVKATSTPTAVSVSKKFKIGQQVYFIPSNIASEYLDIAFLPHEKLDLFASSKVENCDDLLSRRYEKEGMYYGQYGIIMNTITCDDKNYYLFSVEETNFLHKAWEGWVSEEQISLELISPTGLLFSLSEPSENSENNITRIELPDSLWSDIGEETETIIDGQVVGLVLNSVNKTDLEDNFITSFTFTNKGQNPISFDLRDHIEAKNDSGLVMSRGGRVLLQDAYIIQIESGQSVTVDVEWSSRYHSNIYISINSPISDQGFVKVRDNSVFFKFKHPSGKNA